MSAAAPTGRTVPAVPAAPVRARPDLRLAGFAIGVWLAALAAVLGDLGRAVPLTVGALVAAALAGAVAIVRPPSARRAAAIVLAGTALGATAGSGCTALHLVTRDGGPLTDLAARRAFAQIELTVTDDPRPARNSGRPGVPTLVVPATVDAIRVGRTRTELGGRVLVLAADPAWRTLLPGQRASASGRLERSRGGDLLAAVLSARGPPVRLARPPWIQRAAGDLRAGLQRACEPLPDAEGGLLPGLVVGDTSRMDPAVEQAFLATGMTHLTAVSGANVAIVAGLVLLLARWCRAGPVVAAVLAGAALLGFVVLARPSPSVLRAGVMGALALVALAAGRPRAALPALCVAVSVLVLVDPALAVSAGFALSVLATGGLLLLAPAWSSRLRRAGLSRPLADAIAVPAAAQVACAPVVAGLSGTVSLVAVPANLLAVPAVAPATVLGVAAAAVSPVSGDLAEWLARLGGLPARWLVEVARYGADVPSGTLTWPGGVVGGVLLAAVCAIVLAAGRARRLRIAAFAVAAAALLVALPVRVLAPGWPPAGWVFVACAVGQGDALALRTGADTALVVDSGPEPVAVDRCLRRLGVAAVPLVLVSHAHLDHVGGLAGVVRGRRVAGVGVGPGSGPPTGVAGVRRDAARGGLPVVEVTVGQRLEVGNAVLDVLGPVRPMHGTRSDPNNNSVVVRATIGGVRVLLTGDSEREAQQALLAAGVDLVADVLKVPHHGSAYSLPEFLTAVRPSVAVIAVGAGNDYGHPSPGVVGHLRRHGARVLRTDRDGDVAVVRHADGVAVVARGLDPGRPP